MAGSPFLLPEDEQEEVNRREMAAFGAGGALLPMPNPQAQLGENMGGRPGGGRLRPPEPRRRSVPRASFFAREGGDMMDSFNMANAVTGRQGAHMGGMIGQAMSALSDEHDSRVAQERERRRMEHEKELMRMRMAAQQRADEAALIRSLLADM